MYEEEKISKNKLQQDMSRLRGFYDERLASVESHIAHLPTTAEGIPWVCIYFRAQVLKTG